MPDLSVVAPCFNFSRNFGKEAAMLAGLRRASGRAVVLMDADLQHPPELITRMLELHGQGYDQAVARRLRGRLLPAGRDHLLAAQAVSVNLFEPSREVRASGSVRTRPHAVRTRSAPMKEAR
ncbi:hypothetical protein HY68_18630 [Streptomyces sp. AcH 505]|nr:hypothetical protein HY68_18630 [Streptomyces sp. AcH 505]